jgi:hypothetical protein
MSRRFLTIVSAAALTLGLLAGPAAAARPATPDTDCLRAGIAVIGPDGLKAAGPTGAVGSVITGHLFSPGDWDWCR